MTRVGREKERGRFQTSPYKFIRDYLALFLAGFGQRYVSEVDVFLGVQVFE